MAERFIKLPMGCTKSPDIGIISLKIGASKSQILGTLACASELFFEEKSDQTNTIELISYMLTEPEELIEKIIIGLQTRGFLDEKFRVIGMSTISESAERKRRQREKNRAAFAGQSRDSHGTVTDSHGTVTDSPNKINKTKPNQTKEINKINKTPLPPKQGSVDNNIEGSGSFKKIGQGRSGGFDIRDHLPDEDIHEIYRCYAVGLNWNVTELYEKYNAYVANDPPRQPKAAFMGWVKKFTKGKRA